MKKKDKKIRGIIIITLTLLTLLLLTFLLTNFGWVVRRTRLLGKEKAMLNICNEKGYSNYAISGRDVNYVSNGEILEYVCINPIGPEISSEEFVCINPIGPEISSEEFKTVELTEGDVINFIPTFEEIKLNEILKS